MLRIECVRQGIDERLAIFDILSFFVLCHGWQNPINRVIGFGRETAHVHTSSDSSAPLIRNLSLVSGKSVTVAVD